MKYHKKGDIVNISIQDNIKYKVKTINGFELPKTKEIQNYSGPMLSIYVNNGQYSYSCIPLHECLIKVKNKLKERKARDLKVGDIFIDSENKEYTISNIESYHFEGKVYSFMMPSRNYYVNNFLTKNCCRLRLNLAELTRKNGSLFGAGDNTGSIGVVTLNLPKIGYLSYSEEELFNRIEALMILAKESLEQKRNKLNEWFDKKLYPYAYRYLKAKFENHFSTIGLVGMNELCRNYFRNIKKKDWNISTKDGQNLTIKILNFMRQKCSDFQVETGNLYNLEATPAESTSYRLAMHDKKKYPDILTAGTIQNPYYTNSTNLPVDFSENPWDAIDIQNKFLKLYTGGCVHHIYLSEGINDYWKIKDFIKKVMYNTEIPYLTITPTFSHCEIHGFIKGNVGGVCPKCKQEAVENYQKTLTELEEKKKKLLEEIESDSCCE
jgi:anaerobic ribonucleoside-triphosphate reductase